VDNESVDFNKLVRIEKNKMMRAAGMEDAVVDIVVLQWLVQKIKQDLKRQGYESRDIDWFESDQAQSA
jgi:hypothetical protein